MEAKKIEKLKALGDVGVTAGEIAEAHQKIAAGERACTTICAWMIRKAAATGSCAAGEVTLTGLFTLAEIVFYPEGEEFLFPLEADVVVAWGDTCRKIGVVALGQQADKWAAKWCSEI